MPKRMTNQQLESYGQAFIESAIGYLNDEIANDRAEAIDYYYGKTFGDEMEDRSQFVSTDVQDTIESVMPDFMEIFQGGDEVVAFEPMGPEDVDGSKQATEYVTHIWNKDNDGFTNSYDSIKNALLQKTGILKVWWDDSEETKRETLEGLNLAAMDIITNDPDIEILEATELAAEEPLWDVTILRTVKDGRVKVAAVAPEEFLIEDRAVDLGKYVNTGQHHTNKTASELIEMGFDRKQVDQLPGKNEELNEEKLARFRYKDTSETTRNYIDRSRREIDFYELYLWVDWNGDGVAELRQVYLAGPAKKLLKWAKGRGPEGKTGLANMEVPEHPFCTGTPIKLSNNWLGRSIADLTLDIQRIKSTLMRQWLDNLYFMNNGRTAVSSKVNIDDLLFNRPSGVVQVKTTAPDVAGHIHEMRTDSVQGHIFPLVEYFDSVREIRSGTWRYNQDSPSQNAYTDTLGGIQSIIGQAQKRELLMARMLAEQMFKPAFMKILKLVIRYQDKPRMIRLRNEFVEMDPRHWNADMDVEVSVGLGYGTREQRAMLWRMVLEIQEKIIQYQGGIQGPFISPEHIHYTFEQMLNSWGIKNADQVIREPREGEVQQVGPPPDPKIEIDKMKAETDRNKLQIDAGKLDVERGKLDLDRDKADAENKREWAKIELEGQKIGVDAQGKADERDFQREQAGEDRELQRQTAVTKGNGSQQVILDSQGSVVEIGQKLEDMGEGVAQAGEGIAAVAQTLTEAMQALVQQMNAPKEIVRDERGRAVGVRSMER